MELRDGLGSTLGPNRNPCGGERYHRCSVLSTDKRDTPGTNNLRYRSERIYGDIRLFCEAHEQRQTGQDADQKGMEKNLDRLFMTCL